MEENVKKQGLDVVEYLKKMSSGSKNGNLQIMFNVRYAKDLLAYIAELEKKAKLANDLGQMHKSFHDLAETEKRYYQRQADGLEEEVRILQDKNRSLFGDNLSLNFQIEAAKKVIDELPSEGIKQASTELFEVLRKVYIPMLIAQKSLTASKLANNIKSHYLHSDSVNKTIDGELAELKKEIEDGLE